ncbi:sensor histidine kinase, partial [Streptomyces lydicus]
AASAAPDAVAPDAAAPDAAVGPAWRPGRAGPVGGTGLKGLTERLAAAGGTLRAGADGRRGFRVTAELPVGAGDSTDTEELTR